MTIFAIKLIFYLETSKKSKQESDPHYKWENKARIFVVCFFFIINSFESNIKIICDLHWFNINLLSNLNQNQTNFLMI